MNVLLLITLITLFFISIISVDSIFQSKTPSLKNVIVTGANSGIGLATVKNLCASGEYNVIMACRDVKKAKSVASNIGYGQENIEILSLDLADLNRYYHISHHHYDYHKNH